MGLVMIREATIHEAPTIRSFLRLMVEEMASLGGYPATDDEEQWTRVEQSIRDEIGRRDYLFLLASLADQPETQIGFLAAQVEMADPVFEPKRILHISAVYVLESHRRQGIGQALLKAALEWGSKVGCVVAELNTLVRNPARFLYEKAGFREFEVQMTHKLSE